MAQIINDPYSGNIFGRVGKAVGQGLAEQIPTEIKNYRLSKGIEKLASDKNLTPLQQIAGLHALPGGAEAAPTLIPFLERQQQKQAFEKHRENRKIKPASEGRIAAEKGKPELFYQENKNVPSFAKEEKTRKYEAGLVPKHEIENYKSRQLQQPSTQEIEDLAGTYFNSGLALTPADAKSMASQELQQNLLSQNTKNADLRKEFENRFGTLLSSTFGDNTKIAAEIQQDLVEQAEYLVNEQGMTPQEAAGKLTDIAQELGKTYNNLKELGTKTDFFNAKNKTNELKPQYKTFKDYGYDEQFIDLAANAFNVSPQAIALEVSPVKGTEIGKKIEKLKNHAKHYEVTKKMYDDLARSITTQDNLLSIEKALSDSGYGLNPNAFKSSVNELKYKDLTKRQLNELRKPIPTTRFGDLLFDTFK